MSGFSEQEAIAQHDRLLARYGGQAGQYAPGLLQSALAQPLTVSFGQELFPDPVAQAAAYLFYVAGGHCFVDGNKRTGAALCLSWLIKNGYLVIDMKGLEDLAREIADKHVMDVYVAVARLRPLAR